MSNVDTAPLKDLMLLRTLLKRRGVEGTDDGDGGLVVPDPFDAAKRVTVRDARTFGHKPIAEGQAATQAYLDHWVSEVDLADVSLQLDYRAYIVGLADKLPVRVRGDDLRLVNPLALEYAQETDPALAAVLGLNRRYSWVQVGKDHMIYDDDTGSFIKSTTFNSLHAAHKVEVVVGKKTKMYLVHKLWQNSPFRRTYRGAAVYPNGRDVTGNLYRGDNLNLWRGLVGKPCVGNCQIILDHMLEVFHQGNVATHRWELDYWAHLLQRPWEKPHSHIIRGEPDGGSGKDIFATMMMTLIVGQSHTAMVSGMKGLTQKHNADLACSILVIGNEVAWGGDHDSRNKLYEETAQPFRMVEPKGVDRIMVANYSRYLIHTNNERPVAAGKGDRRFGLFETKDLSERFPEGSGSEAYRDYFKNFAAACADTTAVGAFVKHLLERDISAFNPYRAPETDAKRALIEKNLSPKDQWLLNLVRSGKIEETPLNENTETPVEAAFVFASAEPHFLEGRNRRGFETSLGLYLGRRRNKPADDQLARKEQRHVFDRATSSSVYVFLPLHELRERVAKRLGLKVDDLVEDVVMRSAAEQGQNDNLVDVLSRKRPAA